MQQSSLHKLQKLIIVLGIVGIIFVVIGLILDDITFWAIADYFFITIFTGAVIVTYLSWRETVSY